MGNIQLICLLGHKIEKRVVGRKCCPEIYEANKLQRNDENG